LCGEHVNDAVGLLKKYGSEAKWLSGGMLRLAGPTHLIDLYRWRHLLLQAAHSHRSAGVTHTAVGAIAILLRGVGQVMFQNNPITGLLFLVGIFINSYEYGLTVPPPISWVADRTLIRNGLFGFNGVLTRHRAVRLSPVGLACRGLHHPGCDRLHDRDDGARETAHQLGHRTADCPVRPDGLAAAVRHLHVQPAARDEADRPDRCAPGCRDPRPICKRSVAGGGGAGGL
jgi:hypothetical protein